MNRTISEKFNIYVKENTSDDKMKDYQTIYQFPNEYGASVVDGRGSYGLEIAILYFPSGEDEWVISETADTNPRLAYVTDLDNMLEEVFDK